MVGGEDRDGTVEISGRDVVEVIAVIVREHDQIQRWQIRDLTGRLDLAPCIDPVTEIHVIALVQKGRVRQDHETGKPDQSGCVADEIHLAVSEACRGPLVGR